MKAKIWWTQVFQLKILISYYSNSNNSNQQLCLTFFQCVGLNDIRMSREWVCGHCYQAPRAGSSIPQQWALGPDSLGVRMLCAAMPGRAGRGRSGRKLCDRWIWRRVYGWISHSDSLVWLGTRCITVERGGQWRHRWWAFLPSDAFSSWGTGHTTEMLAAADSWAEQQTEGMRIREKDERCKWKISSVLCLIYLSSNHIFNFKFKKNLSFVFSEISVWWFALLYNVSLLYNIQYVDF